MDFKDKLVETDELKLDEMPELDLYMDQVIQLFEKKYATGKRNDDEKILTKTMINNYAKGRLLPEIHKKRYSRTHLIFISLIYQLKATLSIQDIKKMLDVLQDKMEADEFCLEQFYTDFMAQVVENKKHFYEKLGELESHSVEPDERLEKVMLAAQLANLSHLYKRMAERIVDELEEPRKPEKKAEKPKG